MKFSVTVTLKKDVLDPQGKVVQNTLSNLGMNYLKSIRQGKYFEIELSESDGKEAEKKVRRFLSDREITIPQQEEFIFSILSDGLSKGRVIRPVQTNYGIALCGENFLNNTDEIN